MSDLAVARRGVSARQPFHWTSKGAITPLCKCQVDFASPFAVQSSDRFLLLCPGRTGSAISALLRLAPTTATLLTLDGSGRVVGEQEIEAFLIQRGDTLKVPPGAKVSAHEKE